MKAWSCFVAHHICYLIVLKNVVCLLIGALFLFLLRLLYRLCRVDYTAPWLGFYFIFSIGRDSSYVDTEIMLIVP